MNTLMKENGKREARRSRDREFMQLYREALDLALRQGVADAKRLAVEWTIYNSSPHYHVSYERAYKVVRQLLRGGEPPMGESLQLQMWREIAARVAMLLSHGRMSVARALEFVLEHCRASRFFVSERYAYETLVDRARRELRRRG